MPRDGKRDSATESSVDGTLFLAGTKRGCMRRVVVPYQLRKQQMDEAHRGPMGAHSAGNRLFHMLTTHWWWKGMHGDITKFVRNCPECVIVSGGGLRWKGLSKLLELM